MARRDALLRLHKALMSRRDELRRRLYGDLNELRGSTATGGAVGDSVDQAFDAGSEEVTSQIAELESRELHQIERALDKLKHGSYGACEGCSKKIPVTRLNALPFTTLCIECQRELELYGSLERGGAGSNWDKVSEVHAPIEDQRELKLSDIEMDISSR